MSDDEPEITAAAGGQAGVEAAAGAAGVGASRGRRRNPVLWLLLSVLSSALTFVTWIWGAVSGGLDVGETCALRGQPYDGAYRGEHLRESMQIFPLHNKCNESYDLVPVWINPALVLFSLVAAGSLLAACWTTFVRVRRFWRRRQTAR
ncbi:hypothetical protein P1S61_25215 [Streptomyces sp. ME08-AFT2]|uniref:hypothetical protein n=1 Tax=Streptomyces sp. ME08-AFT2 TaxID=3028683 RepID=UPI0029B00DF4|nr:hypothetical protein [Streptomyces sp. ME08-AFT2]MDX3312315.1 hypothetical protein [Streptomyces sp. ME08-AFT2]